MRTLQLTMNDLLAVKSREELNKWAVVIHDIVEEGSTVYSGDEILLQYGRFIHENTGDDIITVNFAEAVKWYRRSSLFRILKIDNDEICEVSLDNLFKKD